MPGVPIELRPTAIQMLWENYKTVATPLEFLFPMVPNGIPGPFVRYDLIDHSRVRPRVNTREGPPDYVNREGLTVVRALGETWRDGRRISPTTLKDLRRPGTSDQNRGRWQIVQDTELLKRRYIRFLEWLRAEGIQGVKSFRPPGMDLNDHFDELLLCSSSCLDATVTAAWNAASTTQALARTNLGNIETDFRTAYLAGSAVGMNLGTVIMNATTYGYLHTQLIAAGYEYTWELVFNNMYIPSMFDTRIMVNNETYIHPVSGTSTNYIPDNVAIFVDTDNARTGRKMVECEAVHVESPDGHMGVFFHSFNEPEAPGEVKISGEWTGLPQIPVPCSQYVYLDVTNAA